MPLRGEALRRDSVDCRLKKRGVKQLTQITESNRNRLVASAGGHSGICRQANDLTHNAADHRPSGTIKLIKKPPSILNEACYPRDIRAREVHYLSQPA